MFTDTTETATKGSAFVRVLQLDKSRDPKNWTKVLLVHNKRKQIPEKKREWKTPGWSFPGGGIQDYANYPEARYEMPDDCACEDPIEAALREMFEESRKIIDIRHDRTDNSPNNESQKLFDLLANLSAERGGRRAKGSIAWICATQELIKTVHHYAKRVLEMGALEYKFTDTSKPDRPPAFVFETFADDLYQGEYIPPGHDDGKNTDKVEWFDRERVELFADSFFLNASAYYDHLNTQKDYEIFLMKTAERKKLVVSMTEEREKRALSMTPEEFAALPPLSKELAALPPIPEVVHPGKLPLYIYRSTIERLDLKPK